MPHLVVLATAATPHKAGLSPPGLPRRGQRTARDSSPKSWPPTCREPLANEGPSGGQRTPQPSPDRSVALFRLMNLDMEVRQPYGPDYVPSPLSQARCGGGVLKAIAGHDNFPGLLAEVLDVLAALDAGGMPDISGSCRSSSRPATACIMASASRWIANPSNGKADWQSAQQPNTKSFFAAPWESGRFS